MAISGYRKYIYAAVALIVVLIFLIPKYERKVVGESHLPGVVSADTIKCAILAKNALGTKGHSLGFIYELFKLYEKSRGCVVSIELFTNEVDIIESLFDTIPGVPSAGREVKDVLLLPSTTDPHTLFDRTVGLFYGIQKKIPTPEIVSSVELEAGGYSIVVDRRNYYILADLLHWHRLFQSTSKYERMAKRYRVRVGGGSISPYDKYIKNAARTLGWDWRLLAALIYKESHFKVGLSSSKGAIGLMQIKEHVAKSYGVSDVFDPQENITAGTLHLKRLQNMYLKKGCDSHNAMLISIAAYNCGEGRMSDCMALAEYLGYNPLEWEGVKAAIPKMNEYEYYSLPIIKYGKFSGKQTLSYLDDIMALYEGYAGL